ncbi:MAG: hypothetical protein A2538_03630 [Candidatus Magasanikbacteria bacterium RIFOXYD2_FULL_41_14]|uniref:Uncharacterized protein n=1 Tax=Candidatus Magasanikbacteria bacterium RIFOXYD2_FULL_41_14 TaxID=1798709 RepID=A0A1F6PCP9_9BACT|nr:MAG: hypothetical protein A2538_03630 [Candidatus Magasanikbacteria bacterium RIFOXYD2_FULL_41_14]
MGISSGSGGGRGFDPDNLPVPTDVLRDYQKPDYSHLNAVDLKARMRVVERIGDFSPILDLYRAEVDAWRRYADTLGYFEDLAWMVPPGLTLDGAIKAGLFTKNPEKKGGIQTGEEMLALVQEPPTTDSIVLWIPQMIDNSDSKDVATQQRMIGGLTQQVGLPAGRTPSFGSATLLTNLILGYRRETGNMEENMPPKGKFVRTDTLDKDGHRVCIGGGSGNGNIWFVGDRDDQATFGLGCYMTLTLPRPKI